MALRLRVEKQEEKNMEKITLNPFTDDDWDGFAGAEPPDKNTEPMMGECTVDGEEAVVIVDAHGISIHQVDDDLSSRRWDIAGTLHFNAAVLLVTNMNDKLTTDELTKLGFEYEE